MSQDYSDEPEAAVVAQLAERAIVAETALQRDSSDPTLLISRHHEDVQVAIVDLEGYELAPRRATGTAVLHNAADFAAYVQRVATPETTVWADEARLAVTAVINDHTAPDGQVAGEPGWRDHTVTLALQVDPEWTAWKERSGLQNLMSPPEMADHLENYRQNITRPDAATMIELADTMRATKNADVVDSTDRRSGATHILLDEQIKASAGATGEIEIPDEFTIAVAPYLGWDRVALTARFRFRVVEQKGDGATRHRLRLGYELVRPDLVQRDAFAQVRTVLQEKLGDSLPILAGAAPEKRQRSTR